MAPRASLTNAYQTVWKGLSNPLGRTEAIAHLNKVLPPIWADAYAFDGGELVTVTLGGREGEDGAVSTLFDLRPRGPKSKFEVEDRVVAVWGLSRTEPGNTRDIKRMKGFQRGVWSATYPGRDRGHFFAHTMGGGTDINLFPQLASVNQGREWRQLESNAAKHSGTFCFIRPIYSGTSWTPSQLEYGVWTLPPGAFGLRVNLFPN